MADSIPSLRRKNKELADRIAQLEAQISKRDVEYVEVVREVNFPIGVPFETPVYYSKEIPVEKIVYVDNPEHLEMIETLQAVIRELTDDEGE